MTAASPLPADPAEVGGRPVTEVAVGILVRDDGLVLMGDRPEGKPYAGYWEFPGGKVEPGETVAAALARELHEELGVDIGAVRPWLVREFDYPHAYVRLHFCKVFDWSGTPHGREGQRAAFLAPPARSRRSPSAGVTPGPLLPAAIEMMRWLALPDLGRWLAAPSDLHDMAALHVPMEAALADGARLVRVSVGAVGDPVRAAAGWQRLLAQAAAVDALLLGDQVTGPGGASSDGCVIAAGAEVPETGPQTWVGRDLLQVGAGRIEADRLHRIDFTLLAKGTPVVGSLRAVPRFHVDGDPTASGGATLLAG